LKKQSLNKPSCCQEKGRKKRKGPIQLNDEIFVDQEEELTPG